MEGSTVLWFSDTLPLQLALIGTGRCCDWMVTVGLCEDPLPSELQDIPDDFHIVAVRRWLPLTARLQELLNCRDVADSCFKCLE